ncbi:hypothetical protein FP828_03645 [bacterium]|nr:hypothetical protein [Candidatus Omnitrophota bacterium]MBA3065567.1 hypothetical protein [bacterium]
MKIEIDMKIVKDLVAHMKEQLGTAEMKNKFLQIRTDWKANPLKVKGSIKDFLAQMQIKFAMVDIFVTTVMAAADKASAFFKGIGQIDPKTKTGAECLEAGALFLDSVVKFPMSFTGRLLEMFDKKIFYFLLQLFFYFHKKKKNDGYVIEI